MKYIPNISLNIIMDDFNTEARFITEQIFSMNRVIL